ncbi:MAG: hypothetical protein WAK25_05220, partial [Acidobacteriaceae bacterium]
MTYSKVEARLFVGIVANGHAGRSRNRLGRNKFGWIVEELVDAGRFKLVESGILLGAGGAELLAERG